MICNGGKQHLRRSAPNIEMRPALPEVKGPDASGLGYLNWHDALDTACLKQRPIGSDEADGAGAARTPSCVYGRPIITAWMGGPMKRRIISAALTSSPAAWVRSLDWGRHTLHTTERSGSVRTEEEVASSPQDGVAALSQQVDELKQKLSQTHRRLRDLQLDTVTTLVAAVEAKDPPAERHSMHVALYSDRLTRPFRLSIRENEVIRTAAVLHDIGKIGIPDAILTKPGPLTPDEWRVVKQHPVTGAAILKSAACLQRELPMVLHHHEWYDGGGYPDGLRGEEIPFGARILHVADAIDAMLSPRSYKGSYSVERVCSELLHGRGVQFDPVVADVAMAWLKRSPEEAISSTPPSKLQMMNT